MPSTPVLRCTAIVVNYNGGEFVAECLRSLEDQTAAGVALEIIVVDNASTDGSADDIERDFPAVRLLRSATNRGFGGGVNLAIAETAGDLIVLLNNDATVAPGFIAALTEPFRSAGGSALAAVTARIQLQGRFVEAPTDPMAYVSATGKRWRRLADGESGGVALLNSTGNQVSRSGNGRDRDWLEPVDSATSDPEVFGFCGGAAAISRSALDRVGLFTADLFMYYEDTDLSWRFRRAGLEIRYAHDAVVFHKHAASSGVRSAFFLIHNIRNRILVTATNGPGWMLRAALVRTIGSAVKTVGRSIGPSGADARLQLRATVSALWQVAIGLPRARSAGKRLDASAALPRDFVTTWLVDD